MGEQPSPKISHWRWSGNAWNAIHQGQRCYKESQNPTRGGRNPKKRVKIDPDKENVHVGTIPTETQSPVNQDHAPDNVKNQPPESTWSKKKSKVPESIQRLLHMSKTEPSPHPTLLKALSGKDMIRSGLVARKLKDSLISAEPGPTRNMNEKDDGQF